jgi:hypothetical protein
MVEILYAHLHKWKNDTILNYSKNGGRGDKGE